MARSIASTARPAAPKIPEQTMGSHGLHHLDRSNPIGHGSRHAGEAQAVILAKTRVAQVLEPAGGHERGELAVIACGSAPSLGSSSISRRPARVRTENGR